MPRVNGCGKPLPPGISVLKFEKSTDGAGGDGGAGAGRGGRAAVDGTLSDADAERGGGGSDSGAGRAGDLNLVKYHRDYLPDGKIWENAPVVGPLVKFQRETYMACMASERGCADLLGAPK